jgi:hypothetical protein
MQKFQEIELAAPLEFRKRLISFVANCMFLSVSEKGKTFLDILKELGVDHEPNPLYRRGPERELEKSFLFLEKNGIITIEPFSGGRILAIFSKQQEIAREINIILNAGGKYKRSKAHLEEALYAYFYRDGDNTQIMSIKLGIDHRFSSWLMARMLDKEKKFIDSDIDRINKILSVKKIFFDREIIV